MSVGNVPVPYFPAPPADYNRQYMAQVVRAFAVFAQQVNNPGPLLATTLTLNPSGEKIEAGELSWNTAEETVDITMGDGVVQQVGFETYMRVKNSTGSTIPNGTVVGFAGVSGEILISKFLASSSANELYFVGVTTHDMPDGDVGPVTLYGKVREVDTSAYAVGTILYASPSTAGGFTATRPTAPNVVIPIAAVLVSDATNGELMVRPTIPIGLDYGTFSSTATQTLGAIDTATAITFNTTSLSNGVTIGTPASRLVVAQTGFYQINVSLQLTSSSSSAKNVYFWLRKNGVDVANTTNALTNNINNGFIAATLVRDISLQANDYVELYWAADSTDISLSALAASAFAPAAPSVIAIVTQIQL